MKTMDADPPEPLPTPGPGSLLEAVLALADLLHQEADLPHLVEGFLDLLGDLLPGRALAVRVLDLHTADPALAFVRGAILRPDIEDERVSLREAAVARAGLKPAVLHSARVRIHPRWDSPFTGIGQGFGAPLVAAGELYGILDLGYLPGAQPLAEDETVVLALANHLSVAVRNHQLQRDTIRLRDYQSRLIEQANALILGVDRSWRVTVFNQALSQLTGYSAQDVIGRDIRDALPEDEVPRLARLFSSALTGTKSDNVEVILRSRGGTRVRTVWSIAAVDSHDESNSLVAIGQDQTRIRELQSQIIQAEKLATLGQLAAGVVHEINNPLTSITVYADYLLSKARRGLESETGGAVLDAGDAAKLDRIKQGAQRILDLARDLVQYAKPAGDEFDLIDANMVALQSLSFCEHLFDRNRIATKTALAESLPIISAVPGQLEQVLINLITNACHAIEAHRESEPAGAGDGELTVETGVSDQGRVFIAVADSGPGIADADRDRVFEPFFTTKSQGKGTGLGLSIARNIVEQHGGTIAVEPRPGGGARFVIVLPTGR